jgi:hypothetical protein
MKNKTLFFVIYLFVGTYFYGCKGADGAVGPAGPTGPTSAGTPGVAGAAGTQGPKGDTGAAGAQGVAGQNGNADVRQVTYGPRIHYGGTLTFKLTSNFTKEIVEKSIILIYIKSSGGYWYSIPGYTAGGENQYRVFIDSNDLAVNVPRVTGTGADVWEVTRILAVPANVLTNGRLANIDYKDYNAVKAAFNLKD